MCVEHDPVYVHSYYMYVYVTLVFMKNACIAYNAFVYATLVQAVWTYTRVAKSLWTVLRDLCTV